jgi:DNA-binding NarL/FixJ family response regulator
LEGTGKVMAILTPEHIINNPPQRKPIRVLLFNDRQTSELPQILEVNNEIQVVGEARCNNEALSRIGSLLPDVILVVTANGTPFTDFSETMRTLYERQLSDKVIIIASNPIRYLGLAVKARIPALLSQKTSYEELVSVIHRIYAWSQDSSTAIELTSGNGEPPLETRLGGD